MTDTPDNAARNLPTMLIAAAAPTPERPCSCHPDDNPPVPCQRRYAITECRAAAEVKCDPELLAYWKTLPRHSNEFLAVELIETLQRQLTQARAVAKEAERLLDKVKALGLCFNREAQDVAEQVSAFLGGE